MDNDQKIEHDIIRAGMTAPRVTPDQVNAYLARVEYSTIVPPGTTSTFTHSYLRSKDGNRLFSLATGHSACVSPENFNAITGVDISRSKCEIATKDALWAFLGFDLFQELDK
jgi:hypothetical protein